MKKKEMGPTLRELRERANLTVKDVIYELSKREINISDKALYSYESGKRAASADMFLALCEIYKCNNILDVFSNIEVDYSVPDDTEWYIIEKYRDLDNEGREHVSCVLEWETKRVKVDLEKDQIIENLKGSENIIDFQAATREPSYCLPYHQRMAAAGKGMIMFDDIPTDLIDVPDTSLSRKADFIIGVNGESMEPTFHDGDKVYVEKMNEIPTGSIGIFISGSECYIKELGVDRLVSHNKEYDDIPANPEIRCVGLVLGKVEE